MATFDLTMCCRMSNSYEIEHHPELPPIGFEDSPKESVRPLKKKKKRKSRLKGLAIASQSFNNGS